MELSQARTDDNTISEEVDWLVDPGTPSTCHTQFLQTQVVAGKMKTMLAKAIAMQGAAVKETFAATSMASARNTVRLEKMEVAFNLLTEELRRHGKALDNFVRCFDIYLCHVLNVSIEVPTDDS